MERERCVAAQPTAQAAPRREDRPLTAKKAITKVNAAPAAARTSGERGTSIGTSAR